MRLAGRPDSGAWSRRGPDPGGLTHGFVRPLAPWLILLAAMTAVFVFGHDRSHFYRPGHHDWLSSHGLALAANFSPDHAFLMFERQTLDPEMDSGYVLYNRFPMGSTALIALAIAPFDSTSSQILAARVLMLLFFAAAAVAAYLSLRRLFDPWAALAAVLLSCSSWYALYYSDMIFNDVPTLFGVLLTFHGIVVFVQEGRFRQLVVKSCAALLLGWQVYALLLPFIVFGAVDVLRRRAPWGSLQEAVRAVAAVLCGRHVVLGVVTLLFGMLVLGLNLANEYRAFGGELLWTEVPTVKRMLWRFGLNPVPGAYAAYADYLAWWPYLKQQAARIGGMSLPLLVAGKVDQSSAWLVAVGAGAGVASLIAARRRPVLAALAVSGLCWTLPMRHYAFAHDFQSLFHLGIPLVLWSAALSHLLGASSTRRAVAVAVTLVVFLGSTGRLSGVGHDPERTDLSAEVMADFKAIRPLTAGKGVFVLGWGDLHGILGRDIMAQDSDEIALARSAIDYYLAGSRIGYRDEADRRPLADFILTNRREPEKQHALLTPDTRRVFLYDRAAWDGPAGSPPRNVDLRTLVRRAIPEAVVRIVETNEPVLRARFDLYVTDDTLVLVKDRCAPADVRRPFFGKATPTRESDLHEGRRLFGFNQFDLSFERRGAFDGDRCWLWRSWPSYGIRRLEFGQYIPDIGDTWRAATSLDIPPRPSVELIDAPTALEAGAQAQVAVQAVNLDPARQHLIRVVYNDHLGARSDCTRRAADRTSAVFSGRTSHTESFAVHGCAPGNGTITAGLRLIADGVEGLPPIAVAPTVSVTVTSQEAPGRQDGEVEAGSDAEARTPGDIEN